MVAPADDAHNDDDNETELRRLLGELIKDRQRHQLDEVIKEQQRQLDNDELTKLRRMITEWERSRWLWHMIGRSSAWIGGVIAAAISIHEIVTKLLLSGKGN